MKSRRRWLQAARGLCLIALLALMPVPALASPVEVVHVRFERSGDAWDVSVTLRHADSGWAHYANVWIVEALDGKELGRRELLHPHEDEQPFTRSERIGIPPGVTRVRVRAGDNVDGIDSNTVLVDLAQASGARFEVRR
jgi:hypothetical protein